MAEPSSALPRHIAIIMDGNGRWARQRGLRRSAGHRAGIQSIRRVMAAADEAGVHCLTLYAFSTENWSRPRQEVATLMRLFEQTLQAEVDELHRNGVRIRVIGRREQLSSRLQSPGRGSGEAHCGQHGRRTQRRHQLRRPGRDR